MSGFVDSIIENFPNDNTVSVYAGAFNTSGAGSTGAYAAAGNTATQVGFKTGQSPVTIATNLYNQSIPFSPPSIGAYFPGEFKEPQYAEYSLQLQRQITKTDAITVTYAGNYGYHGVLQNPWVNAGTGAFGDGALFQSTPIGAWASAGNFGNGQFNATPPDPRFGRVTAFTNNGHSNYNGGMLNYKHSGHGVTGQLSYTYSHSLDDVSNGGEGENFNGGSVTQQLTPSVTGGGLNYSNSDYDVRNNLTGDVVYNEGFKSSNRILNYVAGGWVLGGKTYWRSGEPYSITNGAVLGPFHNLGGTLLAALAPGVSASQLENLSTSNAHAGAYNFPTLNINQFVAAGSQTNFGTLRRNALYGPHYVNTDLSLQKEFVKTEGISLKLGINGYNMFNDVNFGPPNNNVQYGNFGTITGSLAPPTSPYGSFQGAAVTQRLIVLHGNLSF